MSNQIITLSDVNAKLDILTNAVLSNKQTLNIDEAAMYCSVTVSYLYKLTSTQQIPHFKPRGKIVYFDRSELDEWLRQNRVKTTAEIETEAANHLKRRPSMKAELVHISKNKPFTTSLVIAEAVGLKHRVVIRLVKKASIRL